MREQAKKMNVASLRSSEDANKSAEAKLAKVALITISLWFMAWTPYLVINYEGIFGAGRLTPLSTIWGSLFAKANAVYNPIVYGIRYIISKKNCQIFRLLLNFPPPATRNIDWPLKRNYHVLCVAKRKNHRQL